MIRISSRTRRLAGAAALVAGAFATAAVGTGAGVATRRRGHRQPDDLDDLDDLGPGLPRRRARPAPARPGWPRAPRRRSRSSTPTTRPRRTGCSRTRRRWPDGSVTIRTVFHVISDDALTPAAQTRLQGMVDAQMKVLNDSFAGETVGDRRRQPVPLRPRPRPTSWSTRTGTRSSPARASAT